MIPGLIAFATRIGLRGAIIAALAMFAGVQTWRVSSLKGDVAACGAGREADRAAVALAQAEAHERAVAARMAAQERYQQQAEQSNARENELRADLRDIGERFIAANRVRPQAASGAGGGTVAPASDSDSGVPAGMPADAVMVAASDVRACTDAVAYGIAAHDWAAGLNEVR